MIHFFEYFESADMAAVMVSFLSLIGVIYTAWVALRTKSDTSSISKSVNHVQPGEARLYELVVQSSFQVGKIAERVENIEKKLDAHLSHEKAIILP